MRFSPRYRTTSTWTGSVRRTDAHGKMGREVSTGRAQRSTRSIWRRTSSRCSTVRSPASIEPQRSSGSKSRKGNGKQMRAIGIRTFEDKVLQRAVANADDFVFVFEREQDARRVLEVLPKRFERFGLTLHPDKTR